MPSETCIFSTQNKLGFDATIFAKWVTRKCGHKRTKRVMVARMVAIHMAMAVQAPPRSSSASAMPRHQKTKLTLKESGNGYVAMERALFAAGEGRLWVLQNRFESEAKGIAKRKKGGCRTCVCMGMDYYATLGVSKTATKSEIKAAYRELARKYHPDVNSEEGADEKFMEITLAYKLLTHDEKRPIYDLFEYEEPMVKGRAGGADPYWTNTIDVYEFSGEEMGDIGGVGGMGGMRPNTQHGPKSNQGENIRFEMTLPLKEAIFGTQIVFDVTHLETCSTCSGTGAKLRSRRKKTCQTCFGVGQFAQLSQTPFGEFSEVAICPKCDGEGQVPAHYCTECRGDGRVNVVRNINVEIPAGVKNGSTLRVRGEGHAGKRGGPPGDLHILLRVSRR